MNHYVGTRNWTQIFWKSNKCSASALRYWAIFKPLIVFLEVNKIKDNLMKSNNIRITSQLVNLSCILQNCLLGAWSLLPCRLCVCWTNWLQHSMYRSIIGLWLTIVTIAYKHKLLGCQCRTPILCFPQQNISVIVLLSPWLWNNLPSSSLTALPPVMSCQLNMINWKHL